MLYKKVIETEDLTILNVREIERDPAAFQLLKQKIAQRLKSDVL